MKFNWNKARPARADTVNLAGGDAFRESPRLELAALLLTATLSDQYHRTADQSAARVKALIAQTADKRFVAKAALYARREAGLRSVTHLAAGELAQSVKGEQWTAPFFARLVHRPDDALEILAYQLSVYGRPVPNSLKKGLGAALARFDEYQLAKYRRADAGISLVDAVNLVHPPHTDALRKLVNGTLPPAETWETRLTQAGQAAAGDGDALAEAKADVWRELLATRKLGYFALLRNLRNILTQAPELTGAVVATLTDARLIRRSLVMPFRFTTALEALHAANLPNAGVVLAALSAAVDISLENVPAFAGRTLIALDGSGSMVGRSIKIGALFAAALAKGNAGADVMLFSDDARYVSLNRRDSTLTLAGWLEKQCAAAGTNFHAVFQQAAQTYDRIILLSDMQGWMGGNTPTGTLAEYKARHACDPKVYSFDLAGYGTLQFPERNVFCLAGFSDKALETLKLLDGDAGALVRQIEAVEL